MTENVYVVQNERHQPLAVFDDRDSAVRFARRAGGFRTVEAPGFRDGEEPEPIDAVLLQAIVRVVGSRLETDESVPRRVEMWDHEPLAPVRAAKWRYRRRARSEQLVEVWARTELEAREALRMLVEGEVRKSLLARSA